VTKADFAPDTMLKPVHFGYDSAGIETADTTLLGVVLERLKQNPTVRLQITGYCDPRGSEQYNYRLGLDRAKAVQEWLATRGIAATRLAIRSLGSSTAKVGDTKQYRVERRCEFGLSESP